MYIFLPSAMQPPDSAKETGRQHSWSPYPYVRYKTLHFIAQSIQQHIYDILGIPHRYILCVLLRIWLWRAITAKQANITFNTPSANKSKIAVPANTIIYLL